MRTKGSVLTILVIEVVCLFTYFFCDSVTVSSLENRTMASFDMVINNPPNEESIVYKETASERFEEALKDQFFGRNWVVIRYATIV